MRDGVGNKRKKKKSENDLIGETRWQIEDSQNLSRLLAFLGLLVLVKAAMHRGGQKREKKENTSRKRRRDR